MRIRRNNKHEIHEMNIYQKINSIRKQLKLLEELHEKQMKSYLLRYNTKKYQEMPFRPGTMVQEENRIMKAQGVIRELRTDLNRLVFQEGNQELIDWYKETEVNN